jgi:hypothetical protein
MDMTLLHNDCAFLSEWPGVPIANQEGGIISKALSNRRCILLAHHGQLTLGAYVEEATYLVVYLERRLGCRFAHAYSDRSRRCQMYWQRRRTIICLNRLSSMEFLIIGAPGGSVVSEVEVRYRVSMGYLP